MSMWLLSAYARYAGARARHCVTVGQGGAHPDAHSAKWDVLKCTNKRPVYMVGQKGLYLKPPFILQSWRLLEWQDKSKLVLVLYAGESGGHSVRIGEGGGHSEVHSARAHHRVHPSTAHRHPNGRHCTRKLRLPYYFQKKLQLPYYCQIAIVLPKCGASFATGVPKFGASFAIGVVCENLANWWILLRTSWKNQQK